MFVTADKSGIKQICMVIIAIRLTLQYANIFKAFKIISEYLHRVFGNVATHKTD